MCQIENTVLEDTIPYLGWKKDHHWLGRLDAMVNLVSFTVNQGGNPEYHMNTNDIVIVCYSSDHSDWDETM